MAPPPWAEASFSWKMCSLASSWFSRFYPSWDFKFVQSWSPTFAVIFEKLLYSLPLWFSGKFGLESWEPDPFEHLSSWQVKSVDGQWEPRQANCQLRLQICSELISNFCSDIWKTLVFASALVFWKVWIGELGARSIWTSLIMASEKCGWAVRAKASQLPASLPGSFIPSDHPTIHTSYFRRFILGYLLIQFYPFPSTFTVIVQFILHILEDLWCYLKDVNIPFYPFKFFIEIWQCNIEQNWDLGVKLWPGTKNIFQWMSISLKRKMMLEDQQRKDAQSAISPSVLSPFGNSPEKVNFNQQTTLWVLRNGRCG